MIQTKLDDLQWNEHAHEQVLEKMTNEKGMMVQLCVGIFQLELAPLACTQCDLTWIQGSAS